jgi:hypothetical protein
MACVPDGSYAAMPSDDSSGHYQSVSNYGTRWDSDHNYGLELRCQSRSEHDHIQWHGGHDDHHVECHEHHRDGSVRLPRRAPGPFT